MHPKIDAVSAAWRNASTRLFARAEARDGHLVNVASYFNARQETRRALYNMTRISSGAVMSERLSYKEFKAEFLFKVAVMTKADPEDRIDVSDVAAKMDGNFPTAWAETAASDLAGEAKLSHSPMIGASFVSLTGFGLETAEEYGNSIAYDLWEAIDDFHAAEPIEATGAALEATGPVIIIDHMSEVFQGIEADVRETIRVVRSKNELMDDPEVAQKVTELEASHALMKAPQADSGLLRRLLIPTLLWLGKKLGDEAAKALVKRLIDEVTKWLLAAN